MFSTENVPFSSRARSPPVPSPSSIVYFQMAQQASCHRYGAISLVFHCHIILRCLVHTGPVESLSRISYPCIASFWPLSRLAFVDLWNAEVPVHVQRPHEEEPLAPCAYAPLTGQHAPSWHTCSCSQLFTMSVFLFLDIPCSLYPIVAMLESLVYA
eukprot:scaffold836_cov77-Skeletonema_dohrnii-CCMP3373.AAC.4